MNTLTEENYLKCIYKLSLNTPEGITTSAIADEMKTKSATVTDMLKKLSDKELIKYEKYYGVKLTEKGKKIALKIVRKHRLWELFLVKALDFKWDEVHIIAEQLEHIQSDELIARLDKFLGHPKTDPHGDPIPDQNGKIFSNHLIALSELAQKSSGEIAGVTEHSPSFLQYLEKSGLNLGNNIHVIEKHEFDKSIDIKINRKKNMHISNDIAKNILITTHEPK
ncbi:MAG TPA: metal-dependent transcriptional regulator [Bacteroidia bacterium]|nr:metal-dependent transcriptional regulator [Bacteroidia bacterium]